VTQALRFPSEEALRVALASVLASDAASDRPARGWRDEEGGVWVLPEAPPRRETLATLRDLGLSLKRLSPPQDARDARCWAELVALRREPVGDLGDRPVVFLVPDARAVLQTAGELLRLGCDRQELRPTASGCLLRVVGPPFYTVAQALDRVGGLRAFTAAGTDHVFVELGYGHPLAPQLRPEKGHLLLLSPDRPWLLLPDGAWTNVYELLDLSVPAEVTERFESETLPRVEVRLRLVPGGRAETPSLWVIRTDAVDRVERLLAALPEEIAAGFLFAVTDGTSGPVVILRTRPTSRRAATLDVEGEAYCPHPLLPGVFLPRHTALEPPLRRDKLRETLAPDPDKVVLVREGDQGLRVERIADTVFRPLTDWVDYVIEGATELDAWVHGARFDFSAFEVVEAEPVASPARQEPERDAPRGRKRAAPKAEVAAPRAIPATAPIVPAAAATIVRTPVEDDAAARELAACEREFLSLGSPADDPARSALWLTMARLHTRLGHRKDATLCWTRGLWELEEREARDVTAAWVASEGPNENGPDDVERFLRPGTPSREDVSAVAALVTREALSPAGRLEPARVALWLDRHDEVLDLRSLWLARSSLARLVGGDALGLARARDRILAKLHRGLALERDVPAFLRFLGGARDPAQVQRLAAQLESLARRYEKTPRRTSTVEAEPKLTLAYVLFVVAYGCARVGHAERARAHAARAEALLDRQDAIHGFLARAYAARVEQAIEGLPAETPLPPDIAARLNALDKFSRYKVDRVRQYSQILEPHERLDPVVAFQRGDPDPRGAEFTELRGMANVAALEEAIERIFVRARGSAPDQRARLFDGVMDFFPAIGVDRALRYLEEIVGSLAGIAPARQAQLLEEALMLAGHAGDPELVRRILEPLRAILAGLREESAAEIGPVMGGMLRTLRRVGLRDEASELVRAVHVAASGDATPARVARLHCAAALSYLGHFEQARTGFEDALAFLERDLPTPVRLELTRAFARAVSQAPLDYAMAALDRLAERLTVITDSFNTNSHVCISVVAFMESLVLGHASDDLAIGDLGRQWLDDDEYLVRRRVHRDMRTRA
jgi:hypothetical protein